MAIPELQSVSRWPARISQHITFGRAVGCSSMTEEFRNFWIRHSRPCMATAGQQGIQPFKGLTTYSHKTLRRPCRCGTFGPMLARSFQSRARRSHTNACRQHAQQTSRSQHHHKTLVRSETNLSDVLSLGDRLACVEGYFKSGTYALKVYESISDVAIVCEIWTFVQHTGE